MSEREDLEQAIATVEAQRATLGDAAVDSVLAGLRRKLAEVEEADKRPQMPAELQTSGGERRIVTVLFCDVTGSTALAEQMDPESWTEIMDRAFNYLTEPVDRFGGTVARLMGDAILALFGAPVAHEDDPQRAVEAGLAILERIRPYREELRRTRGLDFNVRVGINTGLVVTGRIGSKLHEEYTALGDAANVAARMEQTAAPGTIQISDKTYSLVASQFECVSLGGINVKGKSKPVEAYRVIRRIAQSVQDGRIFKQRINSALVGRTKEFATAQEAVSRLLQGQGSILSIIGEAGVGKSRLVAEVRQNCPLDSLFWFEGRALSYGQKISYWPFHEIFWNFAGINEEDSEESAWQKLAARTWPLFGDETGDILPFLASLIGLETKGQFAEKITHLDGEAIGHQIYKAARRFFERLSTGTPTVLAFEDLHWADESSAALLEHLLPLVERWPLLFLISSRPYQDSPLPSFRQVAQGDHADRYTELALGPLSKAESAQLARNLLEVERMPADVQTMILNKAGGNPFFLEEILRSLIDSDVVIFDPDGSRWQATQEIKSIAIPDTVQGVIMARVDRLDRDARRVLQAASVIGRSFYYRVLEVVETVDAPLNQLLGELEHAQLIRHKPTGPEVEYIFNHALAQDAIYQSMLFRKRRDLHSRVGRAIEKLFPERLEEFYGVLAYHYARAEEWEKAQEYLFKAGDKAGNVAADAEALTHYEQALAAYARVFGDQWDPVQRAVLARKMGEAHFRRGEHEQALAQFQQAFHFLGRPGIPAPHLPTILALGVEMVAQAAHRIWPRRYIKTSQGPVSLAVEEEARLQNLLGWIFLFTERERFLWASLRRLNFSEMSGFEPGIAAGGASVAVVWDMIPLLSLAASYHRRASYKANQAGNLNSLGIANQGFAFHELNLGNFEESTAFALRSEDVFRRSGDLHGLGNALNLLAFNLIHQGIMQDSLAIIDELIATGRDGADIQLVCWGTIGRGFALERLGRFEEAEPALLEGIGIADMLPDYYWKILGHCYLASSKLRQGKLDEVWDNLEVAQSVYDKRGIGGPALYQLRVLQAEAHFSAVGHSKGQERTRHLKQGHKSLKTALKLSKSYRLFQAETLRLQGTGQWLQGKPDKARMSWNQSLEIAGELKQQFELGRTYLEIGLRLQDEGQLTMAGTILSGLGVGWAYQQTSEVR